MSASPVRAGRARFATALGECRIGWTERGVSRLALPQPRPAGSGRRPPRRPRPADAAPPATIRRVIGRLQAHLDGRPDPLEDIPLDLSASTPFSQRAYEALRRVSPGTTTTYGELAAACAAPGGARSVGQAMARNPVPLLVPCHRVLTAHGGLGGFSAPGGAATKLRLLTLEGVDLRPLSRAGVRFLRRADPRLAPIIRQVGPFRLADRPAGDPFTALAEAIVHQQVSMAAGATIFRRLLRATGARPRLTPRHVLSTSPDQLRGAGLSRQKAAYLRDLAERTADGRLPLAALGRQDDMQVIQALVAVKGIGTWSAQMFLIFQLGRLDVLPVDDLGLRKGVQRLHGLRALPTARRVHQLARPWAPFRSIATWYMWRLLEAGGLAPFPA